MWQEFVDSIDGMIVETCDDITKPFPRINVVHLASSDEAVNLRNALRSLVASCK